MKKFDVIQSPLDKRDWYFKFQEKDRNQLPKTLDYRENLLPVRNQGTEGSCYAQAAACMKEWQEKNDKGLKEHLSPQFFYNNRFNVRDEDKLNDEGMFGRDVMKILKEIGICKECDYPYGLEQPVNEIDPSIYLLAKNYCIKSYARIETLNSLKKSLFINGPCLIAFPVYNNNLVFLNKNEFDSLIVGHAMSVICYL